MRPLITATAVVLNIAAGAALAQPAAAPGPYKVVQTAKVGGDGSFDYLYADAAGRRLYIPRSGTGGGRMTVYDLDTLAPVGEIPGIGGHGAAIDTASGHGFGSSKPVAMWDSKTLKLIKTIDVQGSPDGILGDPSLQRVYVFSHSAPNVTVINAVDGSVVGTIDLGGAPEQAVVDGKGHMYVDLEDKDQIAVVDTKAMTVGASYSLGGKCGGPAGLGFDVKNQILFAACHSPATMTMLDATTGKILASLPIGTGVDGATFNPNTMEAFSTQGDGTITVVKELTSTSFAVEQTVKTPTGARTITLDTRTNHIITVMNEYAPPAAPATPPAPGAPPGRGGGRGTVIPGSFSIIVVGK